MRNVAFEPIASSERRSTEAKLPMPPCRVHAHVHISSRHAEPQQPRAFQPMMQVCIGKFRRALLPRDRQPRPLGHHHPTALLRQVHRAGHRQQAPVRRRDDCRADRDQSGDGPADAACAPRPVTRPGTPGPASRTWCSCRRRRRASARSGAHWPAAPACRRWPWPCRARGPTAHRSGRPRGEVDGSVESGAPRSSTIGLKRRPRSAEPAIYDELKYAGLPAVVVNG